MLGFLKIVWKPWDIFLDLYASIWLFCFIAKFAGSYLYQCLYVPEYFCVFLVFCLLIRNQFSCLFLDNCDLICHLCFPLFLHLHCFRHCPIDAPMTTCYTLLSQGILPHFFITQIFSKLIWNNWRERNSVVSKCSL